MSQPRGDARQPELATRLIEQDRAQLAHEIHDALLPPIFAASIAIEQLLGDAQVLQDAQATAGERFDSEHHRERLSQAAGLLADCLKIGRGLLVRTHPAELEQLSWDAAARATLDDQTDKIPVRWSIEHPAQTVGPVIATMAYRVVVEAVRNAVRHAQPSSISVAAQSTDQAWELIIEDDGKGFDPKQIGSDRFGVRSMQSRAELAGGKLTLSSQPGGPTRIHVVIPAAHVS